MIINLQPITVSAPSVEHRDFPETTARPGFSTAIITIGDDTVTIFLPFGGRLTYTNKDTK